MKRIAPSRCERGSAVLIVGVFTTLLLFVGMSVDWGILLRYRRAMQNACDAGVLAGGLNLRSDPATAAPTAQRYAENDMRQNYIAWNPAQLQVTTLDDNNQPTLISPRRLRMEIHMDVPTYFFRLVLNTVHVAVDCSARLANIILTEGLVPLGLNYNAWDNYVNTLGCLPVIQSNVPLAQRTPPCNAFDITLAVNAGDTNPWGSGNTGMLSMVEGCFDCPSGAREWRDTFINGSTQEYCYDATESPAVTDFTLDGLNCANVMTRPGTVSGPVRTAVDARCDSGNPLDRIIMMPLLNPAYTDSGSGRYTTEIWGFAAYELDCLNRPTAGAGNVSIRGGFVSFVSMQAYGRETTFDTGVYTVKLIE